MIRCACALLVTPYELPIVNSWRAVDIDIWQFVVRPGTILSLGMSLGPGESFFTAIIPWASGKQTMSTDIATQIHAELDNLEPNSQRCVLEYVLALKKRGTGMRWDVLKQYSGTISAADAKTMTDAIEAGCEQVNANEW